MADPKDWRKNVVWVERRMESTAPGEKLLKETARGDVVCWVRAFAESVGRQVDTRILNQTDHNDFRRVID